MRQINRILKITNVNFPEISFITNSGEHRMLNLKNHFEKLELKRDDFGYNVIADREVFNNVNLVDNALTWKEIVKVVPLPNGEIFNAYFQLDPILTIENSINDESIVGKINLGEQLKDIRKSLNLSQEELGKRVGSNKQYISKLENNKTDPEFKTLKKIFEVGLNKNIFIAHYGEEDDNILESLSNSFFKQKFLTWAEGKKGDLELIEGFSEEIKLLFIKNNIRTTYEMSVLNLAELTSIIGDTEIDYKYDFPDSWITQARFIYFSDWLNAVKLQRSLSANISDSISSKIEKIAKRDLMEDIFIID
ncbi:XRE family transcriptional regulator [Aequorivita sp. H23M31]|uniref:XRE family transcriptional regulator n=1 Tax=Aequorivita ciconiae TaxID=2494375 RepID=A0A410G6S1_9FLAO|nr:helix-turn-helix transcriptional regulator [Aequorivita sp. H23M31]QAA82973.1 XRE family transcriptional regulator [Aequorivita sp. H23M31]